MRTDRTQRPAVRRARSAPAMVPAPPALSPPHIRELTQKECIALLRRHVVGRMAHSFHDRVDITPIHYVYADGWLFARTSHGAKMLTLRHSPWVAFEVDEIEGVFNWRSVVVHGTAYTMEHEAGATESRLWQKGMALLQRVVPGTGTEDDPVPFRTIVFGIHVDSMTGRSATMRRRAHAAKGDDAH